MLKYTFLYLSIALLSSVLFAEESLKGLLDNFTNSQKSTFCQKGYSFLIPSIRSYEGQSCANKLGASLAHYVCQAASDFKGSHCAQKAQKAGISNSEDAKKYLTDQASNRPAIKSACTIITAILPDLKQACEKLLTTDGTKNNAPARPLTGGVMCDKIKDENSNVFAQDHFEDLVKKIKNKNHELNAFAKHYFDELKQELNLSDAQLQQAVKDCLPGLFK